MPTPTGRNQTVAEPQEVCIDLPGEKVQCWRSSDRVKVILRKHRDVFFDINLQSGSTYTVESKCDFYSPRDRKLLRRISFSDGEVLNLWVGRAFKGVLELKSAGRLLGYYKVNDLDTRTYGSEPTNKPEPLLVVMGQREGPSGYKCTVDDPYGVGAAQAQFKPRVDSTLAILPNFGSQFTYQHPLESPATIEYAAVTEARIEEIQPQVAAQLDRGEAVVGTADQIFLPPKRSSKDSALYRALAAAAGYISGNDILTSSVFKEPVGYIQENFRVLDKLSMTVRIERKAKGIYRVVIKGRSLSASLAKAVGKARSAPKVHESARMGSEEAKFIDGGFGRSGKAGYGGIKRMILTSAENFKGGMKIQGIGTVIDLIVDANAVYFDEKGSKDFYEFLGRAGVSLAKAGATAAVGSLFSAALLAATAVVFVEAAPVALVVVCVVGGYLLAAHLVDLVDESFGIKERVAKAAH